MKLKFLDLLWLAPYWLVLVFFPWAEDPFFSVKKAFFFLIVGFLCLFAKKTGKLYFSGSLIPYGGFILVTVFTLILNKSFARSSSFVLYHFSCLLFLLLSPAFFPRKVIGGILSVLSLILFLQFFGIDALFTERIRGVEASFMATTLGHKNFVAEVLLLLWPFASLTLIFFLWLAALLTLSRTGIVTLLCQITALSFWQRKYRKKNLLIVFLSTLSFVLLFPPLRNQLSERLRLKREWREGSFFTRRLYWNAALRLGREHPLTGLGASGFSYFYWSIFPKLPEKLRIQLQQRKISPEHPTSAHNDFLEVFADHGFLGFFFYLWLHAYLLLSSWKKKHLFLLPYIVFLVSSLFQFPLSSPHFFPLLLVLSRSSEETRRLTMPALVSRLALVMAPLLIWIGISLFVSQIFLFQGRMAEQQGKFHEALRKLDQAIAILPSGKAYFYRGVVREKLHDRGFIHDYEKAESFTGNLHVRWALAKGFARLGNFKEAEKRYLQLIELQVWKRHMQQWYLELAQIKALMGLEKKARRLKEKAESLKP